MCTCRPGTVAPKPNTRQCKYFDNMVPELATCGDPNPLVCPQGCSGSVVGTECTPLGGVEPLPVNINCSGAYVRGDSRGDACHDGTGTFYCKGPPKGAATCSGCRNITAADNPPGSNFCVPRPCIPHRS
ncbi:hypothetical protein CROQUDRAFT_656675 [Cronartium quercuum f. sp. fusiforme G11]|uniref:Uncharacterized protein n=1 Tax=Cronartium quercuum f. sp. fusiforme G11 TaxID=708437 RepID=A0A9P6NMS3_9BASI|nr:hypothetical protein CROQUDRAFT_656675 [Cronartium quercuum f. sp. fusiforme G11]